MQDFIGVDRRKNLILLCRQTFDEVKMSRQSRKKWGLTYEFVPMNVDAFSPVRFDKIRYDVRLAMLGLREYATIKRLTGTRKPLAFRKSVNIFSPAGERMVSRHKRWMRFDGGFCGWKGMWKQTRSSDLPTLAFFLASRWTCDSAM